MCRKLGRSLRRRAQPVRWLLRADQAPRVGESLLPAGVGLALAAYGHAVSAFHPPAAAIACNPPVAPDNQLEYLKLGSELTSGSSQESDTVNVGVSVDAVDTDRWSSVTQLVRRSTRSYEAGEWELRLRTWGRGMQVRIRQRFAAVIEVSDSAAAQAVRSTVEAEVGPVVRMITVRAAA